MARSFAGTDRVDAAAFARPASLTLMVWVRSPGTSAESMIFSHSSSSGTKLAFQTNGDLLYRRSYSTTDGQWRILSAALSAVVPDREKWFCISVTHDSSNNANNAVFRVATEATGFVTVTTTRSTGPVGTVSATSSGNPKWGNSWNNALPLQGDLGPVAYHSSVLSAAAQDAWRFAHNPVQANCLLSYAMDSTSPADDLSTNNRDGTVTGTSVVSGPSVSRLKRWSGSAWVPANIKRHNGTSWVATALKKT